MFTGVNVGLCVGFGVKVAVALGSGVTTGVRAGVCVRVVVGDNMISSCLLQPTAPITTSTISTDARRIINLFTATPFTLREILAYVAE